MISIIVPMYNAEKTIERCLNSIVNQKVSSEVEILVVNDGSKDNCAKIVEDYKSKNNYIQIKLLNKINGGASSARNEGLKFVKGDYILFLDSDDTLMCDSINYFSEIINKNKFDIACFGYEFFDDKNRSLLKFTYDKVKIKINYLDDFLKRGTVKNVIWNKIYRSKFIHEKNIEFHSGFEPNEDSLFVFESLLQTDSIIFLNKIAYNHISDNINSYTNKFKSFHYINALSLLQYYKKIIINKLGLSYHKSYEIFCTRVLCRLMFISTFSTIKKDVYFENLNIIYSSETWKNLVKSPTLNFKYKFVIKIFNSRATIWNTVWVLKKLKYRIQ